MSAHVWTFHEPDTHPDHRWRHYRCDGERFVNGLQIVSVTTALDVLNKPALKGWAANMTREGCWELARWNTPYRRCKKCNGVTLEARCPVEECRGVTVKYKLPASHWQLRDDLKTSGLSHDAKTQDAANRGTSVHQAREDYVNMGKVPNPAGEPEHWRGFMQGMARYIMDAERAGEVAESVEITVGSATHGFAGRCDEVIVAIGKDGKRERRDFKTAKQVRARSHFRQLEAYEGAAVECGEPPTDARSVVVLYDYGEYEIVRNELATYQHFLNTLQVWRDDQPLEKHEDATYRERKKVLAARSKAQRAASLVRLEL